MKQRLAFASACGLALLLLAAAVWCWVELRPVSHAPGVLVEHAPVMAKDTPQPLPVRDDAFRLTRLAGYRVEGRVLAVQRYYDPVAPLAPVDVVLGWNTMSDSAVLEGLEVIQRHRRFELNWPEHSGMTREAALQHSANFHLIPADDEVGQVVTRLKPGMIVSFGGALVEAEHESGRWLATLSPPEQASHNRLLYVSKADMVAAKTTAKPPSEASLVYDTRDLKRWYQALEKRRRELNPNDAMAVREFNREAERYMRVAHPRGSVAPAGRQAEPISPPR